MNKNYIRLVIMILLSVLAQIVTLVKTSIVASSFGTSIEMDGYNFINSIIGLIFGFISFGVTTILIPNYMNKKNRKYINIFILFIYFITFIIFLFTLIFKRDILSIFYNGDNHYFIKVILDISSIIIITHFIQTFLGVTNAITQCEEKFNISKFLNLIPLFISVILLFSKDKITIKYYANIVLIVTSVNLVLQFILIRRYLYKLIKEIKYEFDILKKMLKSFLPIAIGSSVYQLSLSIDTVIASKLGDGVISQLNYSNSLNGMIVTLILGNLMIFIYPKLSNEIINKKNYSKIFDYMIFLNMVISLVSIGIILVGKYGVKILYQRGEFTNTTTNIVYICLIIYSLLMPISAIKDLIYKYFYINDDTYTPFKNSIYTSMLNIVISIILSKYMGIYGVVIGTLIATIISFSMILIKFKNIYKFNIYKKYIIIENIKILLVSIFTIFTFIFIKNIIVINNDVIALIIYSILIVLIYVIGILLVKSRGIKFRF
ncbi:lipid II flippase MurJ [Clostridium mediterraneense]|uniref:lipid II flippase MurJ n=1 Tax=Clostridium mediterraneense TaxID=1805472 RepID=UPI000833908C|nr:lipid II flippase MurJ [Clostridium mediterraneense]